MDGKYVQFAPRLKGDLKKLEFSHKKINIFDDGN